MSDHPEPSYHVNGYIPTDEEWAQQQAEEAEFLAEQQRLADKRAKEAAEEAAERAINDAAYERRVAEQWATEHPEPEEVDPDYDPESEPVSDERMAELVELKVSDPLLYDEMIDIIAAAQAKAWPVPTDATLGVDTTGLPEARALLARFVTWVQQFKDQARSLDEAKFKYLHDLGVAEQVRKQIAELEREDTNSLLAFIKSKGQVGKKEVRAYERKLLIDRLPDEHTRATNAKALGFVEVERDLCDARVRAFGDRLRWLTNDALLEHAASLAPVYEAAVNELNAILRVLYGLGQIATASAQLDGQAPPFAQWLGQEYAAFLPRVRLPGLSDQLAIRVGPKEASLGADPWRELARRWSANPWAPVEPDDEEQ
jgi:hypothetical protein